MDNFSNQVGGIASIYATDTIFILGKGPSADKIPAEALAKSLVIGINDAERIYPTDISIFHADWAGRSIAEAGPKAQLYLTSTNFKPASGEVLQVPHVSLNQESSDLMVQRLLASDVVIEDVLFMTALRVARAVAEARGRTQRVYMLGFDFRPELGYAQVDGPQYSTQSGDDTSLRDLIIGMQENFLLNALYTLQGSELEIIHVGNRPYSRMSAEEFAIEFSPAREHDTWNVSVVAELTTNHFGDRVRLERMVRAAHAAGADFVKVQKRNVDTFYSKDQLSAAYRSPFGDTFADYRHQLELSGEDFQFLDELCNRLGVRWFASILDEPSYRFIRDFKPHLVKLPSTISEHLDYLSLVAEDTDTGIVLSTGMTDQTFENWVLETFRNVPQLYLMQANSAYPTPPRDCNVGVIRHYARLAKQQPRIIPAFSSHDPGWFGSAMAVAAGAMMVEKHVKLGNTEWAHFDAVALDLTQAEFGEYVKKIREAEIIVGSEEKSVAPSEHHKYRRA